MVGTAGAWSCLASGFMRLLRQVPGAGWSSQVCGSVFPHQG